MNIPQGDLVVLGTMVVFLAGLVGQWLLARRSRDLVTEEAPTLRMNPAPVPLAHVTRASRHSTEEEEPVPESGVRVKAGARVLRLESRRGR